MWLSIEVGIKEGRNTLAGERISIKRRAANSYRRKGRERTMVHHHADSLAAMHDLVSRLRAEARSW